MPWSHLLLLSSFAGFVAVINGQSNQPPIWVPSSYSPLIQGIREDTPKGTSLAKLLCTDNENDRVQYARQSGEAMAVAFDGTVTLDVKLDFEQKDAVGSDLTFTCVDINSTTGFNLHAPVPVNLQFSINDANDNAPEFQVDNAQGYAFSVREDAPIGTVVETSIRTVDKDRTVNAALRTMYLICNSPNATEKNNLPDSSIAFCTKFKLNYTQEGEGIYSAMVTLIGKLDYEDRPVYTSKIVATDGPGLAVSFTSTVNIQINLIDTQDMPPFFTNPGDTTTISEAEPIGSTVINFGISARDGDTGDRRAIALSIIYDPKNAFNLTTAVNSTQGDGIYSSMLIINKQLDRETNPGAYMFVLMATEIDKNTSRLTDATASSTYSIFVSDVNDNAPTFAESLYVVNVTEIAPNATSSAMQITGLHITCYDRDEPSNARYSVVIVRQTIGVGANAKNVTDAYSISPDLQNFTGNASMFLKVENPVYLDYDNPDYRIHTVVLVAREQGTKEMYSGTTTVIIYVQDINDNSPAFTQSGGYFVNVSEATPVPVALLTVNATDKDTRVNGQVRYRLEGGVAGIFSIDNITGVISVITKLDYETTTEYVFLVVAFDQATDSRSSQAQITVTVLNANDVAPRFRQSQYQTSVNESSQTFLNPITVTAVDDEVGSNNITYRILSGQSTNNAFVLNPVTGELTLRAVLDFADTPKNANGNNSGVYTLLVEASDNGNPPLTATVRVFITVIDENNHPPILNPVNYYAVVNETSKEGFPVVQIKGTDQDAGDNGKLSYRLGAGSTDNFAVDDTNGWVIVGPAAFDYNVQNQYRLIIIATDGGAPQKSATAFVYVNITDNNNKDPYFGQAMFLINVDDRNATNTVIYTITAKDSDSTASLEYSILTNTIVAETPDSKPITSTVPYDYKNAFGVNSNGGIYIKNKLDHNIMSETSFSLLVKDRNTEVGAGTSTTQVTILIKGEVYQQIKFDQVNQVFMNEDASVGYSPLTVTARDPNNQAINNYQKLNGSSIYFGVDGTTGRVYLISPIDYETDTTPNHLHTIGIAAISLTTQQSATVTASINVVDVNDNNPKFQQQNYTAQVSETALYPTSVVSVFATDADSKSYGPLSFTLNGRDSDDFEIFTEAVPSGPQTSRRARILVAQNKKLDYNRRSQYEFTLVVTDNEMMLASSIRLNGFAQLTITVIDENNNVPAFKENRRRLSIAETAEVSSSIATIIATDADQGLNGEIVYTLEATADPSSSSGLPLFAIGSQSGIVSVARSLIGYGNRLFPLQVRARDRGNVPNSATTFLDIFVISTEENDGNPKWFYPAIGTVFYVPENIPNYTLKDPIYNKTAFFDVTARTGTNVTFAISPRSEGFGKFSINATSGEITVIPGLDREEKELYSLVIFAKDTIDPVNRTSGREIFVRVTDVNDNNATYTNPKNYPGCRSIDRPLELYVRENTGPNVPVASVTACDPDTPEYAIIDYYLYNDNPYCARNNNISALGLNPSGQLVTLRNIDYEQDKEFNMCVIAISDKLAISRKKRAFDVSQMENIPNVAYIHITVVDENDNGPKFPTSTAVGIVQSVPGNGPVTTLHAVDPDGANNSATTYRIETSVYYPPGDEPSSPFSGAFNFRDNKGVLYPTMPSYQGYSGGRFVLKVVATDSGNSSFSDTQTVTIYVYEKGQAVKVILDQKPADGSKFGETIVNGERLLCKIVLADSECKTHYQMPYRQGELDVVSTRYQFLFLRVSEHITEKSYDLTKTDVCFLAVDSTSKDILDIRQVVSLLSESRYQNILRRAQYHFIDEGQCFPTASSESSIKWRDLWWVLVAVAIFVFVCCVILIILVCILYDRYKRYMETRKTFLISQ